MEFDGASVAIVLIILGLLLTLYRKNNPIDFDDNED